MTALMLVFFKVTEGQTANPEWETRLEGVSTKFSEMKEKAAGWGRGGQPAPEVPPAIPES